MPDEHGGEVMAGVFSGDEFAKAVKPMANLAQRNGFNAGVLIAGIDGFPEFIETHGSEAGREAVTLLANIIRTHVRVSDLVGRHGDDGFIVFLPQVDSAALVKIAELVRNFAELETMNRRPMTVSIGASQGVMGKSAEKDLGRLVRHAEENLKTGRSAGGNRVIASK